MHVVLFEKNHFLKIFFEKALLSEVLTFRVFDHIPDFFNEDSVDSISPEILVFDQSGFAANDFKLFQPAIKLKIPIVVLSEKAGAKERIKFLEWGATDCLTKPIDAHELILRMKIICQRYSVPTRDIFKSNLKIDESLKDFFVAGQRVGLSHNEYLLAENFYFHPQRVFGRMSLLGLVWHRHSDMESNGVEVTISTLRKKLRLAGANVEIKSRRHLGYWLEMRDSPSEPVNVKLVTENFISAKN